MRDRHPTPVGTAASGSDDSEPYSPRRDPTVIVLGLIVVGSLVLLLTGVGSSLTGSGGGGPVFPLGDTDEGPTEVDLSLSVNRTTLAPNESVSVTVTDADGDPVSNATVEAGAARALTDADGRATVQLRSTGTVTVRADKAGDNDTAYRSASVEVAVERRSVDLSLSTNRSTVHVDDPVAVELQRADTGEPVAGRVTIGNRTIEVDDGGTTVRFGAVGEYTLTANRSRTATERFRGATVNVTVDRVPVDLSLSTNRSTVRVGDPVEVTVQRADTGEPVSGRVTVGNRTVAVEDGRATVTFDAAGEYTLTANRSRTDTERFRSAATDVTVERRRAELDVWLADETLLVDGATLVRVQRSDTGEGVAATVRVAGRTVETGSSGYGVISGLSAGEYEVRASADTTPRVLFEDGTATVVVERETVRLAVTTNVSDPGGGQPVSVVVTRADTGDPVNGTVSVDGRTYRTGADGRVVLSFDHPGNRTIGASKTRTRTERFDSATTSISVRAPWFVVEGSLSADVIPGDTYGETVTVRNTGNEPGETYVAYRLAGRTLANRTVSLAPGESVTVSFGPYLAPPVVATYEQRVRVRTDVAAGPLTVGNGTASARSRGTTTRGVTTGTEPLTPGNYARDVCKTSKRL